MSLQQDQQHLNDILEAAHAAALEFLNSLPTRPASRAPRTLPHQPLPEEGLGARQALATARQWAAERLGLDVSEQGLWGVPPIPVLGGSPHASVLKALSMLGMGRQSVELLPHLPGRVAVDQGAAAQLYWLFGISVLKSGILGFQRPPFSRHQVGLSHRKSRGMVLMDQRKQACMGSRLSEKACTRSRKGLSKTTLDMMPRAGWSSSTSWPLAHVVPIQAAQR